MNEIDIRDTFPPFVREAFVVSREIGGGKRQIRFRFPNGYGASLINGPGTYSREGEGEFAVMEYYGPGVDDCDWTDETPITSDVIPGVDAEELVSLLRRVSELPPSRGLKSKKSKEIES